MTDATRQQAGEAFLFRELDSLRVAGKREPVRVFELLGLRERLPAEAVHGVTDFEQGLAHYRQRDWDGTEAAFERCLKLNPSDRPGTLFLERIRQFRQQPPADDWDGVWIAGGK